MDLGGQLASGHQHQATRAAGHRVPPGQPGHEREREPERLPRTGLGAPENVDAGQGVGQRSGLDGERHGDAVFAEGGHQGCRDA